MQPQFQQPVYCKLKFLVTRSYKPSSNFVYMSHSNKKLMKILADLIVQFHKTFKEPSFYGT